MMNENTFLNLIKRNESKLFRFAKRLLNDVSLAEDAVQDMILKLWKKRNTLDKYENLDTMVMVAMRNHCFDELKKTKRRRGHYEQKSAEKKGKPIQPDQIIEHKFMFDTIKTFVHQLPEKQRMVVQLRDIEQYEMDEMIKITGMNSQAIRTNLSRARKAIREFIQQQQNYGLE